MQSRLAQHLWLFSPHTHSFNRGMSVRATPSVGSGYLFLLTPQLSGSTHLDP